MPIKPRGKYRRSQKPSPGLTRYVEIGVPDITIAAWTPRPDGQPPLEQVHLIIELSELKEWPFLVRFKSPDTLGFLIEELARYRRQVWPDSAPIKPED